MPFDPFKMMDPSVYPVETSGVTMTQTHISYLFFTDRFVYKVKKPVNLGFLDFSTLEKRKLYCHREVKLNRRLSPDVYLSVVRITERGGKYRLDSDGRVVEYGVKMKRLPEERMLDLLLKKGAVGDSDIDQIASLLARFHSSTEIDDRITRFGRPAIILQDVEENFRQTAPYISTTIARRSFEVIRDATLTFIRRNTDLFRRRMREGRIRDCHGDLRTKHICIQDGIQIIDCIEFNERFRYIDAASELAFLTMDMDYLGFPAMAKRLVNAYIERSGDAELRLLLPFYKCYRAFVRGKVESFLTAEEEVPEGAKKEAKRRARRFFSLALRYARGFMPPPTLLVVGGLIGTGKSSLSRRLVRRFDLAYISSDMTRKRLLKRPPQENRREGYSQKAYSARSKKMVYQKMFEEAERALRKGRSVVVDATFSRRRDRRRAASLAEGTGANILFLEAACSEGVIKERLEKREKRGGFSEGRWEIFHLHKEDFEPWTEMPDRTHLVVNMDGTLADALEAADAWIGSSPGVHLKERLKGERKEV